MEHHEHIPGMISNKMKLRNLLIALLVIIISLMLSKIIPLLVLSSIVPLNRVYSQP